jgi:hypothetical protein
MKGPESKTSAGLSDLEGPISERLGNGEVLATSRSRSEISTSFLAMNRSLLMSGCYGSSGGFCFP